VIKVIFRAPVFYVIGLTIAIVCLVRGTLAAEGTKVLKLLFYIPLAGTMIILLIVKRHLDMARYLLLISPFYMLLIAAGIEQLKTSWRRVVIIGLSVAMGAGVLNYYSVTTHDSDYRPIAAILTKDIGPNDQIIVDPGSAGRGLRYYLRGTNLEQAVIGRDADPRWITDQLTTGSRDRVWLILDYRSSFYSIPQQEVLPSGTDLIVSRDELFPSKYPKVRLLLFERKT
jgi:hypothetical protein